ncbi:LacI family DNA-binding transcriptional regulator [Glaciihabitans sp. UYNi722]|uniref:LacI family DNA-binding transcriptional regulator n=1 Tax=Glaciihabitans sp. UYNi722 TaxID=3156344 RepID=UPI0033977978
MRATVKDVAARAGVSPKTVSNVINGVVFVRPDTLERVQQAIRDLDYVPNLSARGLRNGRSGVIALSLPDLGTTYSAEMVHAFVEVAHERGWSIQIEETAADPTREMELVTRARAHLIDGLILNPLTLADSAVQNAVSLPPVVLIGEVEQTVADQVWIDSIVAAGDMTRHLIDSGYRRIAAVGTPGSIYTSTASQRMMGYRNALATAGIPHDPSLEISCRGWSAKDAAEAVGARIDAGDVADAYFCFTDSMALGAIGALWERGIRVPENVGVAGFDDLAEARYTGPSLTTVSFDKSLYVGKVFDLLTTRMTDRHREPTRTTIPHAVLVRASTQRF